MERVLITFTPDYYPSTTGFAQAFLHFHKSIIGSDICDHVYVVTEGHHISPDEKHITVINAPVIRGKRMFAHSWCRSLLRSYASIKFNHIFNKITEICKKNDVQMILLESMFMAWLIPILKKQYTSIPIVCRIHGTGPEYTAFDIKSKTKKYEDYLLNLVFSSKYIAVTTKYYLEFFMDYYRDYNKFIDYDYFILPNTSIVNSESTEKRNDSKILLLQLGRMDRRGYHQKGFQDTIKALMYIENINPEFASKIMYTTIGGGEREEEFLTRVSSLSIVKHIHYSSLPNKKVKEIEMQSDIILVPSRCEGMSMFATEAIAAGKPLIGTRGNGLEILCQDGYNGYLISAYDYIRLAEAIIQLGHSKEKRLKMGENSKKVYETNCSYKAISNKYELIVRYLNGSHKEG